jgi:Domain of Unknown Function (DUF349)
MIQEQITDLIAWWEEQSFPGKEHYSLQPTGELMLLQGNNVKERMVAHLSTENAAAVLASLLENYASLESRVREMEVEWLATEDKLRLADKVAALKDQLQTVAAAGDMQKPSLLVHDWQHTLFTIIEEHYVAKVKLAEAAEALADTDDWKQTAEAFKELAEQWKHIGYVERGRNEKLWNRVEAARKKFNDRRQEHHKEEEKEMLLNMDLKMDLVEQAEAIAASEEWKKTTETFLRLTEEWKTIGHTMNRKNEQLWQRFIAAKNAFFERKKAHFRVIHTEQEQNYALKLALAEQAEALKDSVQWGTTAQKFTDMLDEWKKIGKVPHEKSEEIWQRFIMAKEHFFDAKKQHKDGMRDMLEQNYEQKKVLLERAQKLKRVTHWNQGTDEINALMEEWKKIGPVPKAYGDTLWKEFNAARRDFFARKDAAREERKQWHEDQKSVREANARERLARMQRNIKEEEEKLADFSNAIENITPGKKAAELRAHLEKLIVETTERLSKLKEEFAAIMARASQHEDAGKQAAEESA